MCAQCVTDPGPAVVVEVGGESREIDRQLKALAQEHRSLAKFLDRNARDMIEDGTGLDKNTACKMIDAASKRHRLADELEDRVSRRDYNRELMDHEKQVRGLRRGRN